MPVYDFSKPADRARFLLSLPRDWKEVRRAWLERWEQQYGDQSETKRLLLDWWDGSSRKPADSAPTEQLGLFGE
ncbi:hypothetical protein HFQ13_09290 [Acidithiobacillus sp. VAN18-1]|jgi:hypothetical protein|uniref:Uncharacterized protein n=1 Tax=Igneacidithiobacillus copahuensis TaxID=2724909 RepID=A0AAE2YR24_9PROT|nr:hypothetical protein [Igneacidithiobacillus copahuensis]